LQVQLISNYDYDDFKVLRRCGQSGPASLHGPVVVHFRHFPGGSASANL